MSSSNKYLAKANAGISGTGSDPVSPRKTEYKNGYIQVDGPDGPNGRKPFEIKGAAGAGAEVVINGCLQVTEDFGVQGAVNLPNLVVDNGQLPADISVTSLAVSGAVSGASGSFTADVSASTFTAGNNITASGDIQSLGGSVKAAMLEGNIFTPSQTRITELGELEYLDCAGSISVRNGSVTADSFTGIINTTSQPFITNVGTLVNLTLSGDASLGTLSSGAAEFAGDVGITGGLTVTGDIKILGGSVILEELPSGLEVKTSSTDLNSAPRKFRLQGVAPHFNQPIVIEQAPVCLGQDRDNSFTLRQEDRGYQRITTKDSITITVPKLQTGTVFRVFRNVSSGFPWTTGSISITTSGGSKVNGRSMTGYRIPGTHTPFTLTFYQYDDENWAMSSVDDHYF